MLPAAVLQLSESLTPHLRTPEPAGLGVCATCRNLIDAGWTKCFRCHHQPQLFDAIVPISYAPTAGAWYRTLRDYKGHHRGSDRHAASVASVLWRFLHHREPLIAAAAGAARFDLVTSVPSSCPTRDATNPLRLIVSASCWHTLPRHRRALRPSRTTQHTRTFDPTLFEARIRLNGKSRAAGR